MAALPPSRASAAPRPYANPLHWTVFAEALVLLYCIATAALLVSQGEALWSLPLLFWGACLAVVVRLQTTPQRRRESRRPGARGLPG